MVRPPKVTDDEIIEAVDSDNRDGFLITTPEVGRVLDIDRRTASKRLKSLEDDGEVVSEPHGRTTGWHLPGEYIGTVDETAVKSGRELEPEVGHKGPPVARKLFGMIGMGSGVDEDE